MRSKNDKTELNISRRTFVSALASLPFLNFACAHAAISPPNFSFVYITDVHLALGVPDNAFKLLQESQLFLQDIIKGVNALKPDFVVFGGDQVETVGNNDGNWQYFIDIVQGLASPWYFVLGEQDVSGKTPVDKMKEFGLDFKGRGLSNSEAYWSCDPVQNVHLIGLDTSQANTTTGDLSEQQLEWLKKDLASNKGKFTIVVSHHPLLAPAPYDGGPPLDSFILPNGSDAREILGSSNDVRLVLSGHLYMNKVQIERDVYHISCAGLNVYPCQYKYFKVTKEAIVMESFEVALPKLIKKGESQLAESSFASRINRRKPESIVQLCEGNPEDQNALLSLSAAKSVRELSKKQIKEDQQRREEELEKHAAETRKGKKTKGKKSDEEKSDKVKSKKSEKSENSKPPASNKKGKSKDSEKTKAEGEASADKANTEPKESGEDKPTEGKPAEEKTNEPGQAEKDPPAVLDKTKSESKGTAKPAKESASKKRSESGMKTDSKGSNAEN